MNDANKGKDIPFWAPPQERILKKWAETASSYRFLHNTCHFSWKRWSIGFSLPVIILSTLTGAANFSMQSFPENWRTTMPLIIGGVNVIAGIIATVGRFLRVDELTEGHSVSCIGFGKLARNITVELSLPVEERSSDGKDFLTFCRAEFDRLIEQSPSIHPKVAQKFMNQFKDHAFQKPEIVVIDPVEIYKNTEEEENEMRLRRKKTPFDEGLGIIQESLRMQTNVFKNPMINPLAGINDDRLSETDESIVGQEGMM
jgi:hypothetical protein